MRRNMIEVKSNRKYCLILKVKVLQCMAYIAMAAILLLAEHSKFYWLSIRIVFIYLPLFMSEIVLSVVYAILYAIPSEIL